MDECYTTCTTPELSLILCLPQGTCNWCKGSKPRAHMPRWKIPGVPRTCGRETALNLSSLDSLSLLSCCCFPNLQKNLVGHLLPEGALFPLVFSIFHIKFVGYPFNTALISKASHRAALERRDWLMGCSTSGGQEQFCVADAKCQSAMM